MLLSYLILKKLHYYN